MNKSDNVSNNIDSDNLNFTHNEPSDRADRAKLTPGRTTNTIKNESLSKEPISIDAKLIINSAKTEYLTYDELLIMKDMYTIYIEKNTYENNQVFKDAIRVRFINRNIEQLDNMFMRLWELNVKNEAIIKDMFLQIAAIYIGNKETLNRFFQKHSCMSSCKINGEICESSCKIYHPTIKELRLMLDRLCYDEQTAGNYICSLNSCDLSTHTQQNQITSSESNFEFSNMMNDAKCVPTTIKSFCRQTVAEVSASSQLEKKDAEFMKSIVKDVQHKTNIYARSEERDKNKTYVADIKIAVFRLIVGVGYKACRIGHSVIDPPNKRLVSESYKFNDLIKLVQNTEILLKYLNIVDEQHATFLQKLVTTMQEHCDEIKRNSSNNRLKKETDKGYVYGKLEAEINHSVSNVQKIDELKGYDIDISLEIVKNSFIDTNVDPDNKKCNTQQYSEALKTKIDLLTRRKCSLPYIVFKNRYSPIIIGDEDEFVPDALIKNGFWYDVFLPLLLRGLSIDTDTDDKLYYLLESLSTTDDEKLEIALNQWFDDNSEILSTYLRDVPDAFDRMSSFEKIIIKQCWDMTKFYLIANNKYNSYENIRDHLMIDLSQYIPFIDEYVGKRYVLDNEMTLTLPQYIGRPVWKFLHAVPELMDMKLSKILEDQKKKESEVQIMMDMFMKFFTPFLKTYPCPYCRNHLNNYVIKNTEIFNYPLEYIFMDWNDSQESTIFKLNIDDKMRTIKTTSDLRLFLWKFHNAVSSSALDGTVFEVDMATHTDLSPDSCLRSIKNITDPDVVSDESWNSIESVDSFDTNVHLCDIECTKYNIKCLFDESLDNTSDISSKNSKTIEEQTTEDTTLRSMSSRNGNYTNGHWPDPNIFDLSIKVSYDNILSHLIELRKQFVFAILETHNNSNIHEITHLNMKIQDLVEKIKADIVVLDEIMINCEILQNVYKVVDL